MRRVRTADAPRNLVWIDDRARGEASGLRGHPQLTAAVMLHRAPCVRLDRRRRAADLARLRPGEQSAARR